ncbi:MAG TPA: exodeoxyribonuclease III [Acidiphilium sp.]|jgi:exodeoxyribonuclease-3|uniref:exodeoxyribonuclease III n=1 Tax=unclassified Acidiphilium TaxID=2617493 RepID=UPI000BCCC7E6|nr:MULTISPECIES: exodeoxyribonuclease III [unclassified Acidiphilium]OYV55234.1 MAG: exodeoxyribonuclease III [Acidiphilium sp. 20-67-58]OYV85482.1 MAG: exodeoxyribonuclease III [Acidiphilium sp. 21-68-69]HQT61775.1 exodeoxyribonuclease III [Acidiphilium sp.]HQU10487.1 exodeoxyribonuclease III [Acidiphilium sp.]
MTQLTIATWNINSVRLRRDLLHRLNELAMPDIICLQETKVPDELFPDDLGAALGLPHVLKRGMKGYNGVAILSRLPLETLEETPDWCMKSDCRHLAARVETGSEPLVVHNFYVPAGGDIPDREENPKYGHKLDFIAETRAHFAANRPHRAILVGDLNIAPLENDVWSHKQLLGVVSHTAAETEGLNAWRREGFIDAIRHFVPDDQKLFTWWSYRNRDWRASNRGRRLDHIWVSADLSGKLTRYAILQDARDWERGSDHVPVALTLDL